MAEFKPDEAKANLKELVGLMEFTVVRRDSLGSLD
jgi:hypothetical protein